MNRNHVTTILLFGLLLFLLSSGGGGILAPAEVTQATYVYEKDSHFVPAPVAAALDKLNRDGINANAIDIDTTDGGGQVPEQYAKVFPAAREAGLPCLVVMSGETVVRVVDDPKTFDAVMEAVQ